MVLRNSSRLVFCGHSFSGSIPVVENADLAASLLLACKL